MSTFAVDSALAAGSWVVTPGERLAREVTFAFDTAQGERGGASWPSPRVLSWNAWLDRLWLAALAGRAFAPPLTLLAPAVATELWRGVIAEAAPSLFSVRGAARGAARAWHTFHAWRSSVDERLPGDASGVGDCDEFMRWCAAYRTRLETFAAIDRATLLDLLARHADLGWLADFERVTLHAFDALTPQQERLVAAFGAVGVRVVLSPASCAANVNRERTVFGSPREELAHALLAARRTVESDGAARVAIVVADLDQRRDSIEAVADEVLCPEHLERYAPDAARPYAISVGRPLASAPIVAAALGLIALGSGGDIDSLRAAQVMGTPFLPDADARGAARVAAEFRWRASRRLRVDFAEVMAALRVVDPALADRWQTVTRAGALLRLPREWARAWTTWLAGLGWPGTRVLSSAEWQSREAWTRLLGAFAVLGPATGHISAEAALARLSELAAEQLFQPQAPIPPIRILGIEEAPGIVFDEAWLVGFDDEQWPPPVRPSPWLPLGWQRARAVPDAAPAAALARARRMTAQLGAIAPRIVMSHATAVNGSERGTSPLFVTWPETPQATRGTTPTRGTTRSLALWGSRRIDEVPDLLATPVTRGSKLRGGANVIESQSACPFQAFARFRLGVERSPAMSEGIGSLRRGTLLHAALAAFWTETGSSSALAALSADDLARRVETSAAAGIAKLAPATRASLPPLVVDGEYERLATTLHAWIERCERPRPPFTVVACERAVEAVIEGVALSFRIDRIDLLGDGSRAIVDYKSGEVGPPRLWFTARPQGTQLSAYAVAVAATDGATTDGATTDVAALDVGALDVAALDAKAGFAPAIGALAYAQVKAGALRVRGIVADTAAWPGLEDAGTARGSPTAWDEALRRLASGVEALVRELRDGHAAVTPRDRGVCERCDLHSLCRIRDLDGGAKTDPEAAADELGAEGDA